jgi:hypothetical protein
MLTKNCNFVTVFYTQPSLLSVWQFPIMHLTTRMAVAFYCAAAKQAKQIKLTKAAKQWHQALESRAWRSWQDAAAQAKARRQIAARWMQPAKVQRQAGWRCCIC